jgi:nucleoside-triphosphatase THEP1
VLDDVARRLAGLGVRVGGVVQPAHPSATDREGYRLRDPGSGDERPFVVRQAGPDGAGGRCVFDPDGWTWAAVRIRAARSGADAVIVDELGRLEAHGRGHVPALAAPVEGRQAGWWVVSVREDREEAIARRLGPFAIAERIGAGADPARLEAAARRISRRIAEATGRLGGRED